MTEPKAGFEFLMKALDRLNVPFLVGGSLASSVHGIGRSTEDIDFIANLSADQIGPLAKELASDFYADPIYMAESFRRGQAFNVVHYASGYKFDIFPLTRDAFHQAQFQRREVVTSELLGPEPVTFPVATAEDTILAKLAWYKLGGCTSQRQWRDLLGVVKVQQDKLDLPYLRKWAEHLQVQELLEELLTS